MEKAMKEFLDELMSILIDMGNQIAKISKKLGVESDDSDDSGGETSEIGKYAAAGQAGYDAVPVHKAKTKNPPPYRNVALCGCQGNPNQPYLARIDEPVTLLAEDVTCPGCLKIMAEREKS